MLLGIPYEIWRDIPEWEGYYQISTLSRVRSLTHEVCVNVFGRVEGKQIKQGKIIKQFIRTDAYNHSEYCVNLSKNGHRKQCRVHQLLALTFIPNPNNLPEINHKDENPLNNKLSNIEWCSRKYNNNYGTRNKRAAEKNRMNRLCKTVSQYTLDMVLVNIFNSTREASRVTGVRQGDISACLTGRQKTAKGFIWKYSNEIKPN